MKDLYLIIFPTILAVAHIIGSSSRIPKLKRAVDIEAFSAGFSIAYVFVVLIPEIFRINPVEDPRWPMLFILAGFSFFHVSLRFVYVRLLNANKSLLSEVIHIGAMATFSLVLAYSVTELINTNFGEGIVLLVFAVVHIVLSEIWENREFNNNELAGVRPMIMILATMLGGVLSIASVISRHVTTGLYAFAAGALVYIAIREELPVENTSRPIFFLLGAFSIVITFLVISLL
ncbi:hypothetical protein KC640_01290 [Candidatus Dojkabacteria bacterium]|uniref:Uncharacterized protein n=1 Tax=Candidatus Dojkabacteria bacterium TaxID=2099670 RepID=A0A955KZF4_9BACT|nr:hypothetical protein [Candidatus Dojkabacteria bacterium]